VTVERIACGHVNCFVVQDGDDAILVDTGTVKFRDKVEKACEQVNLSLIVLTHGHWDQVQNAQYLSKKYHVPIAIHKLDYPLTKDNFIEPLYAHSFMGKVLLWIVKGRMKKETMEPFPCTVFLKEGMDLKEYGVDATVIRLAGHTKGSIGLKAGRKDFIVGDALMHFGKPSISKIYWNYEKTKQSAQIISQSGERKIHFGHGRSVTNRFWK
jgi:glyoxylase-like metal-dependent hydrolase (beta-lactamase superfamily II)